MSAPDLARIAPTLSRGPDGIWHAAGPSAVDYPDEANAFCFQIEDRSFWFQHRNRAIVDTVRRFPPTGPIADVGAGNGFVSLALRDAGFPVMVIEPGPAERAMHAPAGSTPSSARRSRTPDCNPGRSMPSACSTSSSTCRTMAASCAGCTR